MNRLVPRAALKCIQNANKTNAAKCWMVDCPHALLPDSAFSSYQPHAPHSVFQLLSHKCGLQFYCSSCSSNGRISSSRWMMRSNSSLSMPDAFANRNKLLMSVLMCCFMAVSAWL
jgi:hypothetical protein